MCAPGVFISFKGGRCVPTSNDQRAFLTLSPHSVGWPFRPPRILPLVGRWRVTTGPRSYKGWSRCAMLIVKLASTLLGGATCSNCPLHFGLALWCAKPDVTLMDRLWPDPDCLPIYPPFKEKSRLLQGLEWFYLPWQA